MVVRAHAHAHAGERMYVLVLLERRSALSVRIQQRFAEAW